MTKSNNLDKDYKSIIVKKGKAAEIINRYACFGWKKTLEKPHFQYENLVEVEFSRPHKIKNKDMLQFLEVNMEASVIAQGNLEKKKHSKTLILSMSIGFLSLANFFNAFYLFFNFPSTISYVFASIMALLSVFAFIFTPIKARKLFKKETLIFNQKNDEYNKAIETCTQMAKDNLGGNYEQNN